MTRGLFLALVGLLLCSGSLWAQPAVSLVAAGQLHGMQARFAGPAPAGSGVTLVARPYRAWVLGGAVWLSPRVALQATAGLSSFGLAFERQPSGNIATFQQDALEFALVVRRQYGTAAKPGRSWFTEAGVDVEYIGDTFGVSSFGFGGAEPSSTTGPGSESTGAPVDGCPYRAGLRLGAGREWALSSRQFVALAAVASLGLHDLQTFELRSVV